MTPMQANKQVNNSREKLNFPEESACWPVQHLCHPNHPLLPAESWSIWGREKVLSGFLIFLLLSLMFCSQFHLRFSPGKPSAISSPITPSFRRQGHCKPQSSKH